MPIELPLTKSLMAPSGGWGLVGIPFLCHGQGPLATLGCCVTAICIESCLVFSCSCNLQYGHLIGLASAVQQGPSS